SPALVVEAASLIETEARIIRSRAVADRVVARLELTKDPEYAVRESLAARLFKFLMSISPGPDMTSSPSIKEPASSDRYSPNPIDLLMSMLPRPHKPASPSDEDLIAAMLMRYLKVTNDPKSYLISIAYTSDSPERSAQIANAFADEYLRIRSEAAARREFADLAAIYGPKHPILSSARAKLDEALQHPHVSDSTQFLMLAAPNPLPSGPNRTVILGLALIGGFGFGVMVALLRERSDTGFRTDSELVTET